MKLNLHSHKEPSKNRMSTMATQALHLTPIIEPLSSFSAPQVTSYLLSRHAPILSSTDIISSPPPLRPELRLLHRLHVCQVFEGVSVCTPAEIGKRMPAHHFQSQHVTSCSVTVLCICSTMSIRLLLCCVEYLLICGLRLFAVCVFLLVLFPLLLFLYCTGSSDVAQSVGP